MLEPLTITPEITALAASCLRGGGLVAFPTETVYGLGANACDGGAVARIFEAKRRPQFNPLIVHVTELAAAENLAVFDMQALRLARAFWPGPLTLVLPRKKGSGLSELVSAGLPTVAIRVPSHPAARDLIAAAGLPIAAPSANASGQLSPTQAGHVAADLGGRVDMILDGGPCAAGLESTIVAVTNGALRLLRAGALEREALENVIGDAFAPIEDGAKLQAPGMLASHYAPNAELRLNAETIEPGEAFLGFGSMPIADRRRALNLSSRGDLREAASNLFGYLRELDASGIKRIAVAPIPEDGLGEAINDRLRRAAAPRPRPARSENSVSSPTSTQSPSTEILNRFASIVGENHALSSKTDQQPYLTEWRRLYHGKTPLVLRPGTVGEIAEIVALANETGTRIVPQGGNTGLVGGQIPFDGEIVLSLQRLKSVRSIDTQGNTMIVEAGVTLAEAQKAAEDAGRLFPLSIAAEGTAQIGGVLSTNAGGVQVLAYGNARQLCLGLEVVTADGQVWDGLRRLRKDNTGYDLRDLFIGAEGTLGIITAAVLKLWPQPKAKATAFAGMNSVEDAAQFFDLANEMAAGELTAFELMPRIAIDFVTRHAEGTRDPLETPHPWYVLMELSSLREDEAQPSLEKILVTALEKEIVRDAVLATSLGQSQDFWRLRDNLSEVQIHEGGSIKNDVSVPVAALPDFLNRAIAAMEDAVPGCRPVAFGHYGDGNIHFNVSQPVGADKAAFMTQWDAVVAAVNAIVLDLGGSISAEHGIGYMKRKLLPTVKSPVEIAMMRQIKAALDPNGILNPGKVL